MSKVYYTNAHAGECHKNETRNTLGSWGLYAILDKGEKGAGVWDFMWEKRAIYRWMRRVEHTGILILHRGI